MKMQTDIEKLPDYLHFLPKEQISDLKNYFESLIYFNAKMNLVSKSTLPIAARQHFVDCVQGLKICNEHANFSGTVYDFGSGNGFPGLVLAILRRDIGLCLIERDMRKVEFLKHVASELKLNNVTVFPNSYEKLDSQMVSQGITRALGSVAALLIQTNSLFPKGGVFYHFKSENWSTEIANCPTQVFSNWNIETIGQYTLPESNVERFIIASTRL
jgi:16S rRNA (guanine527-N7)-methyltransferase